MSRYPVPQFLLTLVVGLWLGGLTFYAGIVVPIGTETVGGTEQGFVTQRVTNWLNALGVVALLSFGANAWIRERTWAIVVTWLLAALLQLSLLALHPLLDVQLDLITRTIRDTGWFYECHRAYLIVTAALWLAGLSLVWLTLRGGQPIARIAPLEEIQ